MPTSHSKIVASGDWLEEGLNDMTVRVDYMIRDFHGQNASIVIFRNDDCVRVDARCLYEALKGYFKE